MQRWAKIDAWTATNSAWRRESAAPGGFLMCHRSGLGPASSVPSGSLFFRRRVRRAERRGRERKRHARSARCGKKVSAHSAPRSALSASKNAAKTNRRCRRPLLCHDRQASERWPGFMTQAGVFHRHRAKSLNMSEPVQRRLFPVEPTYAPMLHFSFLVRFAIRACSDFSTFSPRRTRYLVLASIRRRQNDSNSPNWHNPGHGKYHPFCRRTYIPEPIQQYAVI
jgi:hypothetical protein